MNNIEKRTNLERAVIVGRVMIEQQRRRLSDFMEDGEDPKVIAAMRKTLLAAEEVHAQHVAMLHRLKAH